MAMNKLLLLFWGIGPIGQPQGTTFSTGGPFWGWGWLYIIWLFWFCGIWGWFPGIAPVHVDWYDWLAIIKPLSKIIPHNFVSGIPGIVIISIYNGNYMWASAYQIFTVRMKPTKFLKRITIGACIWKFYTPIALIFHVFFPNVIDIDYFVHEIWIRGKFQHCLLPWLIFKSHDTSYYTVRCILIGWILI